MKKTFKLRCTSEVATSKFVVDSAYQSGNVPDTDSISNFIKSPDGLYQAAKSLINPKGLANISGNDHEAKVRKEIGLSQGNWEMLAYRPSEMLAHIQDGAMVDDILEAYKDAVENFYNKDEAKEKVGFRTAVSRILKWDSKEGIFKDDSEFERYNEALFELMEQDPHTYTYLKNWVDFLHTRPKSDDWGSRAREALLRNSISVALLNSTQLFVTVLPNSSTVDTVNGIKMFLEDRQNEYKELKEMGIGERTHMEELEGKKGFDVFTLPEKYNQGLAYYIGKAEAMRTKGLSASESKNEGIKFNEKVNFIPRPGNVPRAYWNGTSRNALTLMSYAIQFNKMYWGAFKNVFAGGGGGRTKSLKFLAKYSLLGTALFGVNAIIPAPIWWGLDDETKEELVKISKYSLVQGLLGLDFSEQLKPGNISKFVPVNWAILEQFIENLGRSIDKVKKSIQDDDLESLIEPENLTRFSKLAKSGLIAGAMLDPRIANIIGKTGFGGGQLGEFLEAATRIGTENYERTDFATKQKYETSWQEELYRILGKPRSETEKAYNLQ